MQQIVASLPYCVCQSVKKIRIALPLVSWLGLYFSSKVILQTLINELLTGTFRLKAYKSEQFQKQMKKEYDW